MTELPTKNQTMSPPGRGRGGKVLPTVTRSNYESSECSSSDSDDCEITPDGHASYFYKDENGQRQKTTCYFSRLTMKRKVKEILKKREFDRKSFLESDKETPCSEKIIEVNCNQALKERIDSDKAKKLQPFSDMETKEQAPEVSTKKPKKKKNDPVKPVTIETPKTEEKIQEVPIVSTIPPEQVITETPFESPTTEKVPCITIKSD